LQLAATRSPFLSVPPEALGLMIQFGQQCLVGRIMHCTLFAESQQVLEVLFNDSELNNPPTGFSHKSGRAVKHHSFETNFKLMVKCGQIWS